MLKQFFFDFQYRFSKPPWDSGVTPPEVVALIESGKIAPGRALDLGCGTGTNSIFLAQHGFTVIGIDFSPKAIATARAKARRANVNIEFDVADVTRLDFLREPFDFVLDIGCFHAVDAEGLVRYAANLARLTRSGTLFMLYAFSPRSADDPGHLIQIRNVGVAQEQVEKTFAQNFALERVEQGTGRGDRISAWYWFRRQETVASRQ